MSPFLEDFTDLEKYIVLCIRNWSSQGYRSQKYYITLEKWWVCWTSVYLKNIGYIAAAYSPLKQLHKWLVQQERASHHHSGLPVLGEVPHSIDWSNLFSQDYWLLCTCWLLSFAENTRVAYNGGKTQPTYQHLHISHQLASGLYTHGSHFAVCAGS